MYVYNADHIKKLRKENGYTMDYVAKYIKVSLRHYCRLEKGERPLNTDNLAYLKSLYPMFNVEDVFILKDKNRK